MALSAAVKLRECWPSAMILRARSLSIVVVSVVAIVPYCLGGSTRDLKTSQRLSAVVVARHGVYSGAERHEVLAPARGEVVEDTNLMAVVEQALHDVRADEAAASGDECAHSGQSRNGASAPRRRAGVASIPEMP